MISSTLEALARRVIPQGRLLHAKPLTGGVSAQVTLLEVAHATGKIEKLVIRRRKDGDSGRMAREFKLLTVLKEAGVAVPGPRYADGPVIVLDYIGGVMDFNPVDLGDYLRQMAAALAHIHDTDTHKLTFLPQQVGENPAVLRHGDFWPGNLLWWEGALVAVIDWEDAVIGDPLADLANARLEVLWAFGAAAMQDFTRHYQALRPRLDLSGLPRWDLHIARGLPADFATWAGGWPAFGRPDVTAETLIAGRDWFLAQAVSCIDR